MATFLTADEAVAAIAARIAAPKRVFLPFGPAEPVALREAWRRAPHLAAGLSFCGVPLPGLNTFDYAALDPAARVEAFMMSASLAPAAARGQIALRPLHYRAIARFLAEEDVDVAIAHVARPDADGTASLGICADLTPAALTNARLRIALVNAAMPAVAHGPRVRLDEVDIIVETDTPLVAMHEPEAPAGADAIADTVAGLVRNGDTIQIGIGKLPGAILRRISGRRDLRIHSGLIGAAHVALLDADAIADTPGAITTGTIAGDAALYARFAADPRLVMAPVSVTHDHDVLARIDDFVSINAALEVDLHGQVNAEFAGGAQIAGVGGMADFVRGAAASSGGRAIIAVQAAGKGGASRIVPRLESPAVTLSRADAPIIVTEFGAADLRRLTVEERAHALIAIAPPDAREGLRAAWDRASGRTS